MYFSTSFVLIAASLIASVKAVTLFEGLAAANATKFSNLIESDPSLTAIFTSPDVKTVFAPSDDAVAGLTKRDLQRSAHLYIRQATNKNRKQQYSKKVTDGSELHSPDGGVVDSGLPTDGGGASPIVHRVNGSPSGNSTRKRQTSNKEQVHLYTGLGNNVTVLKEDTPFDGGLIHTVNDFFTEPLPFSATLSAKGLKGFAAGLNSTNATSSTNSTNSTSLSTIINTPAAAGVTVFVPSDSAFAAAGGAANVNLAHHVVPNFLGVTPNLKDGLVLTTQAGTTLTIHVQGGEIFLGTAKILANDVITSNGAVQVIDQILSPIVPVTGAATGKTRSTAAAALSVIVSLGFARFMM